MPPLLRRNLAGPLVFAIGLLCLTRSYLYYGTLLHGWDAQFYYAAAHSLVFDRDLDITNDLDQTPYRAPFDPDTHGHFRNVPRQPSGRVVNVFPVGLPLVEVIGLVSGRGLRAVAEGLGWTISGPPGYSVLEVNTVAVWLLAVFALGMHVLYGIIDNVTTLSWRTLSMLATWVGTSLFFYSAVFPFMAHATGFTLLVCIAALALRLKENAGLNATILRIATLTTLLFLVRPQQALFTVLLIPPTISLVRRPWREWLPGTLLGLTLSVAGVLIQCWIHEQNIGRFSLIGRDPGSPHPAVSVQFHWTDPHFGYVLFSAARGLLFVTPVFLLGFVGCLLRGPAPRLLCQVLVVHFLIQLYLVACWSDPTQGDAFGIRMFCECTPMVTLGLINLYSDRRSIRILIILIVAGCMMWTMALLALYLQVGLKEQATWGEVVRDVLRLFHLAGGN